jgi:predicted  nucleic acid-binding Zn-ribbon protein
MTDYYLNAKSRIERYDKKLSELEENEKIYTKTEYLKLKHDLEAKREKYNGALIEMSNLNLSKNQINGRLEDLNFIKRSFKIHQKKFIGIDEEGTEYYV